MPANDSKLKRDVLGTIVPGQVYDDQTGDFRNGTRLIHKIAGERDDIAVDDGGRVSLAPGATHYFYIAPNSAAGVVIAAPGSAGGPDDYILQVLYNVITPATSTITITDGLGVVLDGAVSNWPLLAANAPAGPGVLGPFDGWRSKTGAWTVKTGAGVEAVVFAITK